MTAALSVGLTASLLSLPLAAARQPLGAPGKTPGQKVAAVQQLLDATRIDTKAFQEEMPLARFLEALTNAQPAGQRVELRLDEEAFGNKLAVVANTPVRLPPPPGHVTLRTALHRALERVGAGTGADYRVGPTHVAVTTPERALYSETYDVRDLVEAGKPALRSPLEGGLGRPPDGSPAGPNAGDPLTRLVHLVMTEVAPESWGEGPRAGNLRVLNGARLEVHANAARHQEIAYLLAAFRRTRDVAVVMNARLYEVERAFYAKHIAPLLAEGNPRVKRRLVEVDGELFEKLQEHTPVLKEEPLKIWPWERAEFLSVRTPFRYVARPGDPKKEPGKVFGTGLAGVSFRAHPVVSGDRRSIRLKLTQEVSELVEMRKSEVYDPVADEIVEVDSPHVQKASLTAALEIWDGVGILMPVEYRPPRAAGKDRVWVLLARPQIYIEEEEEAIRKANAP